ncbi:MAG: DUF4446 family protein [Candidatus Sungbacteria bacterium]|nr:DUF4446 family protein [Candidatus Sungbacteria bacterium]
MTTLFPIILSIISILATAVFIWLGFDLRKKVGMLFGGLKPAKEGDIIRDVLKRLMKVEAKLEELEPRISLLETISKISVQKVGFLRFNPFQDTGGDQSFILTMLDREDNGVLISSLYAREGARVYAKNIERGKSKHPLSEEEKGVLEETIARNS